MRILRFDSVGGASGDMILAALIDCGADVNVINKHISSLDIGAVKIEVSPFASHGLQGRKVIVSIPPKPADHAESHHHHRNLNDIIKLIEKSSINDAVKAMSIKVFTKLAKAEAKVHDTLPEQVHFHEVGAEDSIADIVGSCIALDLLKIDRVQTGPLPIGHGSVNCQHGVLPVPAPATVELLKEIPVVQADIAFELVTPTGAALISSWINDEILSNKIPPDSDGVIKAVGQGFGQAKLNNRPNLLRAMIVEYGTIAPALHDECLIIECNVDDTVPELLGALTQKLMSNGALDVFTTPIQMKKQRPGILLTVLCKPSDRDQILDLIFSESTTFGVREHMVKRTILERRHLEVNTPYGTIRVKIGSWKGRDITHAPEYEDCASCANKNNVSVRTVFEAASQAVRSTAGNGH